MADTLAFSIPLSHGRKLTLRLEPGSRPTPLYRLAIWAPNGMQAGGFGGTTREITELFLALDRLARLVDGGGWPGEGS